VLKSGLPQPRSVAVDATHVYFSADRLLARCDLATNCALAHTVLAEGHKLMSDVIVHAGSIYYAAGSATTDSDSHRVYICPLAGCPTTAVYVTLGGDNRYFSHLTATPSGILSIWDNRQISRCPLPGCGTGETFATVISQSPITALAVDQTDVYFVGTGVARCPLTGTCTSATPVSSGSTEDIAVYGDNLYLTRLGIDPTTNSGRVFSCPKANCTTLTTFASVPMGPTELAVDASGVYWLNPTEGTVRTCPLSGCVGPPRILASNQIGCKGIVLDATSVYWVVPGAAAPATPNGTVMKVAK
jgi:hypothetical protein